MMIHFRLKTFLWQLLLSLGGGALVGFLTREATKEFMMFTPKPAFTPPGYLFPIVWSVLYFLMAVSATWILGTHTDAPQKKKGMLLYYLQLAFNFVWPFLFFTFELYLLAFVWLIALWALILGMEVEFGAVNRKAAYLQIPYLLWVTFAAVLNFFVYRLN